MDTNQWPQGIGLVKPIETPKPAAAALEKKPRPQKEQALNCPRCNSTNTKFCYYNNYSLSQPRYFCKTCRRYWTEGGTLRSVPVGGGSRKNKRSSSSTAAASSVNKKLPDLSHLTTPPGFSQSPKIHDHDHDHAHAQDLNLSYPPNLSGLMQHLPNFNENPSINISSSSSTSHMPSALEFLKSGGISTRGFMSSLMSSMPPSDSTPIYSSVQLPMQEFKPKLSFSLDGFDDNNNNHNGSYGNLHGVHVEGNNDDDNNNNSARLFLPYEDLKPLQYDHDQQIIRGHDQEGESGSGYWNGMLGGGSW